MVVVDCNVVVHLLLEGEQTPRARALLERDADWRSEALLIVELTNVLATAMRARGLALDDAVIALTQAREVVEPGLHAASHFEALETASRYGVSAYDARYLVVARDLGARLVTEDAQLRRAAPELTRSLVDAVGY
jgi:predicted nucleic acid-binding protein